MKQEVNILIAGDFFVSEEFNNRGLFPKSLLSIFLKSLHFLFLFTHGKLFLQKGGQHLLQERWIIYQFISDHRTRFNNEIMRAAELRARKPRKFVVTTGSMHNYR